MARRGGIKLPDASDVQQVGIQSDPGVRVPDTSVDLSGAVDILARGVDSFVAARQQEIARQQKQLDANSSAEAGLNVQKAGQAEYMRLQTEGDFADPTTLKGYNDYLTGQVNQAIDKLPDGVSEQAKVEIRQKLEEQQMAMSDQASVQHLKAGQAKSLDLIDQQINTLAAQASSHPGELDSILRLAKEQLSAFNGTLSADAERGAQTKAREAIISSAAFSLVDKGQVKAAQGLLSNESYVGDISPQRREQLNDQVAQRAEMVARAAEIDAARYGRLQEQAQKDASRAAANGYFHQLAANTADPVAHAIMMDDTLLKDDKLSMLGVADRRAKPDTSAEISHATSLELFQRIHLPDGDPNKITDENVANQEYAAGHLNWPDLEHVRTEIQSARSPEGDMLGKRMNDFFGAIEPQINQKGLFGLPTDPGGGEQFYRYQDMVRQKVQEYRAAKKDPFMLFNPASPDYLGKSELVNSFKVPLSQQIENITSGLGAPAPAASLLTPTAQAAADVHAEIVKRASKQLVNASGTIIYLVDNQWVDGTGAPVK